VGSLPSRSTPVGCWDVSLQFIKFPKLQPRKTPLALVTNQFFRLHPLGQEAAVLQPYTNTAAKEVKCIFTSPAIKQYCPDSDKLETYISQSAEARGGLNKAIPTAWTMSPGLTPCVYNMPTDACPNYAWYGTLNLVMGAFAACAGDPDCELDCTEKPSTCKTQLHYVNARLRRTTDIDNDQLLSLTAAAVALQRSLYMPPTSWKAPSGLVRPLGQVPPSENQGTVFTYFGTALDLQTYNLLQEAFAKREPVTLGTFLPTVRCRPLRDCSWNTPWLTTPGFSLTIEAGDMLPGECANGGFTGEAQGDSSTTLTEEVVFAPFFQAFTVRSINEGSAPRVTAPDGTVFVDSEAILHVYPARAQFPCGRSWLSCLQASASGCGPCEPLDAAVHAVQLFEKTAKNVWQPVSHLPDPLPTAGLPCCVCRDLASFQIFDAL